MGGKLSKYQINYKSKDLFIALLNMLFFKKSKTKIPSVIKKKKFPTLVFPPGLPRTPRFSSTHYNGAPSISLYILNFA